MYCPKCHSDSLVTFEVDGQDFTIERCSKCGGLWFDGGELEQSLGELAAKYLKKVPPGSELTPLPCPHCQKKLYSFKYPGTYATVEMCKACGGIWLDKNEFDEISTVRKHRQENNVNDEPPEPGGAKGSLLGFINRTIENLKF
jgi:Zn-finger nucleic acid-binding protein